MAQNLSSEIIDAVANSEGVEPSDLEVVLGDYIDLDAVNQLADHGNSTWTLSFELPDHSVTVTSDGVILVDNQREKNRIPS